VTAPGQAIAPDALKDWYNQRASKTERLSDLRFVDAQPRSAIGKVFKRELRASRLHQ